MSRYPGSIEPEELRDMVLQSRGGVADFQIIDVRDDDFRGGMIPGAINVPSEEWHDDERVDQLVLEQKDKRLVVFHCLLSQQRGPFTASRFLARLSQLDAGGAPVCKVAVLRGGFKTWYRLYRGEEGLVVPCEGDDDYTGTKS